MLKTDIKMGKNILAPTAYELLEINLPKQYKFMKQYIASFALTWKEKGVIITCDGWTGPTRMHIINFFVYSMRRTIFHELVDASEVQFGDVNYYLRLMKKVIEEAGPDQVIQIVTDNEAAMKAAGKKLINIFLNLCWTA